MSGVSAALLLLNAVDLTSGYSRCGSRLAESVARFFPAYCRPVSYKQIRRSPTCMTNAVVYIPVRAATAPVAWACAPASWFSSIKVKSYLGVSS